MALVELRGAFFRGIDKIQSSQNIFKFPLNFTLKEKSQVAVIGDTSKTKFLSILCGNYIALDANSRRYPQTLNNTSFKAELLKFVNNGQWGHGAHDTSGGFTHLSSRYEFFKDLEVDELVKDFIANQSYNSNIENDKGKVMKLIEKLKLGGLENQFITTLSNGQFRRTRIAKELYSEANLLCIDDPFLGLDPLATETVSEVLREASIDKNVKNSIVIGLRIQDKIPDWIREIVVVNEDGIVAQGLRDDINVSKALNEMKTKFQNHHDELKHEIQSKFKPFNKVNIKKEMPLIELNNVNIKYKGMPIIKDLTWTVLDGEKWHVRGRNGSGKTTLLSLITLDHPQSWNKSIKVFGVERSPGKVNYFDTNKYIGFTSPELHAIFPKKLSIREVISTGFVVGSYIPPKLNDEQRDKIDFYLNMMDLNEETIFGDLTTSKQKLVLLLRSIINDPKILILDEALSAMSDDDVIRGKYLIDQWPGTCLIIGHVEDEVPQCHKYISVNGVKNGEYEIGLVG